MAEVDVLTKLFTTNINMSRTSVDNRVSPPLAVSGLSSPYGGDNSRSSSESTSDPVSESSLPSSPQTSPVLPDGTDTDICIFRSGDDGRACKKISRALRQQRNLAEKQRRDKLNTCIGKLAAMVPLVSMSQKRINKSGILRLTASYLRLHQGLLKGLSHQKELKPLFLTNQELGSFFLEALDGFMLILNNSAKVVFVSEGIEKILGHSVIDVLGQNVLDFVHQDDKTTFVDNVLSKLTAWDYKGETGNIEFSKKCSGSIPTGISFYCSMLEHHCDPKLLSTPSYKLVHIVGQLKLISNSIEEDHNTLQAQVGKFFIGVVKLCVLQPFQQLPLNTNPNEVSFRSSLEGRFIFVDQRLSVILGYLPSEVIGLSGYEMIFHEDHLLSAVAHTQLLQNGGFRGIPVRLVTRTKGILYFIAWGRLIHSQQSDISDTMLCHCTLISNEEGEKALAVAKHRYTPYTINLDLPKPSSGVFDKNGQFLPIFEQDLPAVNSLPPKRPRGRPRKYPIGSMGASSSNFKRLQPSNMVYKNGNIKKGIEKFITSYAMQLSLNIGSSDRSATLTEIDASDNSVIGTNSQSCDIRTHDSESMNEAYKPSLDPLCYHVEELDWCAMKNTGIDAKIETTTKDCNYSLTNVLHTPECIPYAAEDESVDIDSLEEIFFQFSR